MQQAQYHTPSAVTDQSHWRISDLGIINTNIGLDYFFYDNDIEKKAVNSWQWDFFLCLKCT